MSLPIEERPSRVDNAIFNRFDVDPPSVAAALVQIIVKADEVRKNRLEGNWFSRANQHIFVGMFKDLFCVTETESIHSEPAVGVSPNGKSRVFMIRNFGSQLELQVSLVALYRMLGGASSESCHINLEHCCRVLGLREITQEPVIKLPPPRK